MSGEEFHLWLADFERAPYGDDIDRLTLANVGSGVVNCWSKTAINPQAFIPQLEDKKQEAERQKIGVDMFAVWVREWNQKH